MAEGRAGSHLVVWDSPEPHDSIDATFVDWNGYVEGAGTVSILRYVEENADGIRDRYLEWVDQLGESRIGDRRIVDRMAVGASNFSLWWMSSIAEKSFWTSSTVATVVRLLALDDLVGSVGPVELEVVSDRPEVRRSVRRIAVRHGLKCRSRRAGVESRKTTARRMLAGLVPRPVWAIRAWVDHLSGSRPVRGRRPERWSDSESSLFLLSCFGHLIPDTAADGWFDSRYWHGMYEVFRETGMPTNWVHYLVATPDIPDLATADRWLQRIDANPVDQGNHVFLDSYASPGLLVGALVRWLRQLPSTFGLRAMSKADFGPEVHGFLWPAVRREWLDDLRGRRSMQHLLWLATFEAVCEDMPRQRRGLYLYEGVAWERAFVHAWRSAGHGELVGVPHATVRFWDLRYYLHPLTRERGGPHSLPQPDRLVRNNVTMAEAFDAVGYPAARIVDCEALRYAHLLDLEPIPRRPDRDGPIKVLVLGEMRPLAVGRMLGMLTEALTMLDFEVDLAMKSHPNSPVRPGDHPRLNLTSVEGSLADLVGDFDAAFSSHGTSAGVDVLMSGLPVVVWLDDSDLNLSDLRGQPGVCFVGTPRELADGLKAIQDGTFEVPDVPDFFTLEKDLPRWRSFLDSDERSVGSSIGAPS